MTTCPYCSRLFAIQRNLGDEIARLHDEIARLRAALAAGPAALRAQAIGFGEADDVEAAQRRALEAP